MSKVISNFLVLASCFIISYSFSPSYTTRSKGCAFSLRLQSDMRIRQKSNSNDETEASPKIDNRQLSTTNLREKESVLKLTALAVTCLASTIAPSAWGADDILIDKVANNADVFDPISAANFAANVEKSRALNSDEFIIKFENKSLGLGLTEVYYKGFPVTSVTSIKYPLNNPNDPEFRASNPLLKVGAILVGVEGNSTDGIPLKKISELIREGPRPLNVKFRDPSRYFQLLDSASGPPLKVITTSYLPANARDPGAPEQLIVVERLELPPPEERRRASVMLDVMEIQYVAQIPGKDDIVDSSKERTSGSTSGSIYYILGQQNGPPGKLPPGWDLTLRGMVVGEKRRITLPYTLAYDRAGSKDKKIPPFSKVIYTVRLVSLT